MVRSMPYRPASWGEQGTRFNAAALGKVVLQRHRRRLFMGGGEGAGAAQAGEVAGGGAGDDGKGGARCSVFEDALMLQDERAGAVAYTANHPLKTDEGRLTILV